MGHFGQQPGWQKAAEIGGLVALPFAAPAVLGATAGSMGAAGGADAALGGGAASLFGPTATQAGLLGDITGGSAIPMFTAGEGMGTGGAGVGALAPAGADASMSFLGDPLSGVSPSLFAQLQGGLRNLGSKIGPASGKLLQLQAGAKALGLPGIPGLSPPPMPTGDAAGGARPFNAPMGPNSSLGTLQQMTGPPTGGGSMSAAGLVGNRMGGMGGFPGALNGMPPQLLMQLLASRGILA